MLWLDWVNGLEHVPVNVLVTRRRRERATVHPPVLGVEHSHKLADLHIGTSHERLEEVVDDLNCLPADLVVILGIEQDTNDSQLTQWPLLLLNIFVLAIVLVCRLICRLVHNVHLDVHEFTVDRVLRLGVEM